MPTNIFYAEEGSITIGGTDFSAEIKEINVTGGNRDVDQVRTFGNNTYPDEKPADPIEVSMTVVARDSDFWQLFLGGRAMASGTGSAFEEIPRVRQDIIINLYDLTTVSGAQLQIRADSAYGTQADLTLNATDHAEQSPTFKCLTKDFIVQATTDRATIPIT